MYLSLLFWLALLLPGYVLVRHIWKDDLDSGLLGMIGLSYLAVFGLLSPISILCYLLHAPLWVFSTACFLATVMGAIEIVRQGWWGQIGKLAVGALGIELLIVAADMVMGARAGALMGADAVLHLTRIRFLLDHGFSNYDPFVAGEFFFPIYHTNLQHALYAACSQLTGIPYFEVWFASLPWAKLLIAAGAYYMGWCVFDRHWVGWVAAVYTVGWLGPVIFLVYPNKLAPFWIAAYMIGFAVQACQTPCTWRSPLKLALGSLVLGQVHGLYAAFTGIVLGPVLAIVGMIRFLRRQPDRWRLAACTAALGVALPFVLVSKSTSRPAHRPQAATEVPAKQHKAFRYFDNGWIMMKPRAGWGTPDWRSPCLGVGICLALAGSRRKQAGVILAIASTAVVILHAPPICTAVVNLVGKEWILTRLGFVLRLGFVVFVPALAAFLVGSKARSWWVRSLLSLLALFFAATLAGHKVPYTWANYYIKASASWEEREASLVAVRRVRAFCQRYIPRGVTVLLPARRGMLLTMAYDSHIVAPKHGSNGVPDMPRRRRDLEAMLAANTPWEIRRELLRKYEINYFLPKPGPVAWIKGHVAAYRDEGPGLRLYVLTTD